MSKVVFDTPALYGDHHVIEVRRILLALPGIQEIYASSCFHWVEVSYDPQQVSPEVISDCLASAGYLDPLPVESEPGVYRPHPMDGKAGSRRTVTYEPAGRAVSFSQDIQPVASREWPCPGMGKLAFPQK